MKRFFSEFKTFITRGNVVDMAVGVMVGSSFTAIVNGMSNFILKPFVNFLLALIFGAGSLSDLYTVLRGVYAEDGTLDLAQSIYIDWGSFVQAIINFLIIAFVLFTIVKLINRFREESEAFSGKMKKSLSAAEERRTMRRLGIRLRDKEAVAAYYEEKRRREEAEAEEARRAAEEAEAKAAAERAENPTAEELLKEILKTLKEK